MSCCHKGRLSWGRDNLSNQSGCCPQVVPQEHLVIVYCAHQARLADATEGARAREAVAAREHSEASAALGRELGSARERLAAVTAELEQVAHSSSYFDLRSVSPGMRARPSGHPSAAQERMARHEPHPEAGGAELPEHRVALHVEDKSQQAQPPTPFACLFV